VETTAKRVEGDATISDGDGTPLNLNDPLLTLEEAASILQLSVSAIRSYIRRGTLTPYKVAGSRGTPNNGREGTPHNGRRGTKVLESQIRELLKPIE
jgi:Helix-turn-helix domain